MIPPSGRRIASGEEEMENHEEMEEDSTSKVSMFVGHGTFMSVSEDGTVTEIRNSTNRQRVVVNVSEDVCYVTERYFPLTTVDTPAFRSMIFNFCDFLVFPRPVNYVKIPKKVGTVV